MKRNGTSLSALALAGLLVFPLAPHAAAQSSVSVGPVGPLGSSASASIQGLQTQGAGAGANGAAGASASASAQGTAGAQDTAAGAQGTAGASVTSTTLSALVPLTNWVSGGETGVNYQGKTWYYHSDGIHVVDDKSKVDTTPVPAGSLSIVDFAVNTGRAVPANKVTELRNWYTNESTATNAKQPLNNWKPGEIAGTSGTVTYRYHSDRFHVVPDGATTTGALPTGAVTIWQLATDTSHALPKNLVEASLNVSTEGTGSTNTGGSTEGNGTSSFTDQGSSKAFDLSLPALPMYEAGKLAGNWNGKDWFYSAVNNRYVVSDKNLVNTQPVEGQEGFLKITTLAENLNKSVPENIRAELALSMGSSESDLAKAAAIALPALLLIGGVTWYLNQDGQTYVLDSSHRNTTPTPEERQASANMLSSHRAEVEAQAPAQPSADTSIAMDRGIPAETGNNILGKGLIALLIASVLGAAAFLFGRRQLV